MNLYQKAIAFNKVSIYFIKFIYLYQPESNTELLAGFLASKEGQPVTADFINQIMSMVIDVAQEQRFIDPLDTIQQRAPSGIIFIIF